MVSITKIGWEWGGVWFRNEENGRELDDGTDEVARWRFNFRWPIVENSLVPIVDVVQEFFFAGYEDCAVIRPNYGWGAPAGANSFNYHHAATRFHARDHLDMDGKSREAGQKRKLHLFSVRESFDRSKERSELINARVWKRGFLKASLSRGRSCIIAVKVSALPFRHFTHRETIVLRVVLSLTTANLCCTKART